jgi:hypothetical protein
MIPLCQFCQNPLYLSSCTSTNQQWGCRHCPYHVMYHSYPKDNQDFTSYSMSVYHKERLLVWNFYPHAKLDGLDVHSLVQNNTVLMPAILIFRYPLKITPANIEEKLKFYLTFS